MISRYGHYRAFKTDLNHIYLVKTKIQHKCLICEEIIPRKSYCLGKAYRFSNAKTCLKCAELFLNNFISSVNSLKIEGENVLKDIQLNKEEYEKTNNCAKI